MKKSFRIRIDDEEMTVTVERQGDELVVERNGERYRVAVLPSDPAGEQEARNASAAPAPPAARDTAGPSTTAARDRVPPAGPPPSGTSAGVPAPITGTIKEVLVKAGESVSQGERVMMMEAMKMDIEIVAPSTGTVVQVFVGAGDSVKENQPLFRIE